MAASSALASALSATRTQSSEPTENVRRRYLDTPGGDLLVVFSGHFPDAAAKGYDVPFEFQRFLGQHPLGTHTLFIRDPSMSWYLCGVEGVGTSTAEVAEFVAEERRSLEAQRLFTMGSSMGGYAALLFGHLLAADTALVFGPQVYLDQATRGKLGLPGYSYETSLMRVERLAHEHAIDKYLKLTNLLPLNIGMAHIHLGQNESGDITQARGFNDQPNVKFVVWPGGNHMVVKALRDEGKLLPLLRKHFAGGAEASASAEALRAEGNELVKAGDYARAEEVYSKALDAGGGSSHHLVLANRSLCLLKLGRAKDAWYDADAALRLEPSYAKAYYRRALCEAERGFVESALKSVAEARALDPADKALSRLELDLRKRRSSESPGPPAEALSAAFCE